MNLTKIFTIFLIICTLALVVGISLDIHRNNEIEERCQAKGWDGMTYEKGKVICNNISQAEKDTMETRND